MIDTTTYVASSFLWAMAGLAVGYVGGSISAAHFLHQQQRERDVMPYRATRTDNILGIVVILMAVASVIATAVSLNRQSAVVACQSEFNAAFISAAEEARGAAADERMAQRKLLTTPNPDRDPAIAQQAVTDYLNALALADARRTDHPYPQRPNC